MSDTTSSDYKSYVTLIKSIYKKARINLEASSIDTNNTVGKVTIAYDDQIDELLVDDVETDKEVQILHDISQNTSVTIDDIEKIYYANNFADGVTLTITLPDGYHIKTITQLKEAGVDYYTLKSYDNNGSFVSEDEGVRPGTVFSTSNNIGTITWVVGSIMVSGQVNTSGGAVGDPHIVPILGDVYELPNNVTSYRMVEGEDLIINASTRFFTQEEKLSIQNYYISKTNDIVNASKLITDGVVQHKVFMQCEDITAIYDFDTKQLSSNKAVSYTINKRSDGYGIVFTMKHSKYGFVKLECRHYTNPQVFSGVLVDIRKNYEECVGLLVRNYEPSAFEVLTLTSTENKTWNSDKVLTVNKQQSIIKKYT
jgi:hypothetical protein